MANRSTTKEAKDTFMGLGMLALALLILMALDERVPNPFSDTKRRQSGRRRRI